MAYMTNLGTELLPCPFCGGKAYIQFKEAPNNIIRCMNSSCVVQPVCGHSKSWEICLSEWNTRAKSDAAPLTEEDIKKHTSAIISLAFKIPAPNIITPQIVQIAIELEQLAAGMQFKED